MLAGIASWLMFLLGSVAVVLATAAVFTPRLHPLPFLLLALLCFTLSSQRLYRGLLWHPRIGPPLRAYLAGNGLSRRAKAVLLALLFVATLAALSLAGSPLVRGLVAAAALAAGDHVLSQPTRHRPGARESVSFG